MTIKRWGLSAVLMLAGLLLATDAHAQRGGPPGGRPPGGGGGRPPGGVPGGAYGRPGGAYYPNVYSPYRGGISIGIGVGGIGGYGVYGSGYYPYSFAPSYYPYSIGPSYYTTPSIAPRYLYDAPIIVGQSPNVQVAPAMPAGSALVRVLLPDASAKVWFDGTLTKQDGGERYFHTPKLEPGSTYTYRIRAAWMEDGMETIQERVVNVSVGETTVADFR